MFENPQCGSITIGQETDGFPECSKILEAKASNDNPICLKWWEFKVYPKEATFTLIIPHIKYRLILLMVTIFSWP